MEIWIGARKMPTPTGSLEHELANLQRAAGPCLLSAQNIASGANVKAKDDFGSTPLHTSALLGLEEMTELLIAKGANVKVKDDFGTTPLHQAAQEGYKEVVELFIANGADVNSLNEDRETPLDLLSSQELIGETAETAIILRKHGAKTGEELKAEGK